MIFSVTLLFLFYSSFGQKYYAEFRLHNYWLSKVPAELDTTSYLSVVVISEQKDYIFRDNKLIGIYPVSTGSKDRYESDRTLRQGVWRMARRVSQDLEPLYGPRLIYLQYYNPYKKQFIDTLKAFHGTDEPHNLGRPTSMGCVYHHNNDIIELYEILPDKTLVITVEK